MIEERFVEEEEQAGAQVVEELVVVAFLALLHTLAEQDDMVLDMKVVPAVVVTLAFAAVLVEFSLRVPSTP